MEQHPFNFFPTWGPRFPGSIPMVSILSSVAPASLGPPQHSWAHAWPSASPLPFSAFLTHPGGGEFTFSVIMTVGHLCSH